jgi:hypothetical protein
MSLAIFVKHSEVEIDVSEKANSYLVKADIPGVKKEDINIRIDGNMVSTPTAYWSWNCPRRPRLRPGKSPSSSVTGWWRHRSHGRNRCCVSASGGHPRGAADVAASFARRLVWGPVDLDQAPLPQAA